MIYASILPLIPCFFTQIIPLIPILYVRNTPLIPLGLMHELTRFPLFLPIYAAEAGGEFGSGGFMMCDAGAAFAQYANNVY